MKNKRIIFYQGDNKTIDRIEEYYCDGQISKYISVDLEGRIIGWTEFLRNPLIFKFVDCNFDGTIEKIVELNPQTATQKETIYNRNGTIKKTETLKVAMKI